MQNKIEQKKEIDQTRVVNTTVKTKGLFMLFLNWISRGAQKAAKEGGKCFS